jgi:uncharacterized protein YllA (UPF0747 family)
LIGSACLAKKVKKRMMKEYLRLNPIDHTVTEVVYNQKQHHKKLSGLFGRQYNPSFFVNKESEKFIALFKLMETDLLKKCREEEKSSIVDLLHSGSNQMLAIFDRRK